MLKSLKKEKGFTLIELLVVIAILGILAAVVVPNVSKFIGSGDTEANTTELKNVRLGVTALLADSGTDTLDAAVASSTDISAAAAGGGAHTIAEYLEGADDMKCQYAITTTGGVTQSNCS